MTPELIDSSRKMDALLQRLNNETLIAVDTEFHRETTYYPQLALVQIATTSIVEPPIQLLSGFLVQPWCNQGGKDGNYAHSGQNGSNSIERMDGNFPHGKDVHPSRPIRSQTLESKPRNFYESSRLSIRFIYFRVQFGCKYGGYYGNNGQNGLVSPCFVDTMDAISHDGHNGQPWA